MLKNRKALLAVVGALAITAVGATQLKELIKIVGVGAAVKQFGPQIDSAINKLSGFKSNAQYKTKVVPIISAGISSRKAIGAAQVMGPPELVNKVEAVAQLDQDLFGREIKIRAMIPIDSKDGLNGIRRVDGVGVSGIVDLKL